MPGVVPEAESLVCLSLRIIKPCFLSVQSFSPKRPVATVCFSVTDEGSASLSVCLSFSLLPLQ